MGLWVGLFVCLVVSLSFLGLWFGGSHKFSKGLSFYFLIFFDSFFSLLCICDCVMCVCGVMCVVCDVMCVVCDVFVHGMYVCGVCVMCVM